MLTLHMGKAKLNAKSETESSLGEMSLPLVNNKKHQSEAGAQGEVRRQLLMAGSVMFLTCLVRTSARRALLLLGDEQCFSEQSLGTCMSPEGFGFCFISSPDKPVLVLIRAVSWVSCFGNGLKTQDLRYFSRSSLVMFAGVGSLLRA